MTSKTIVMTDHLGKRYGDVRAVDDLSLDVERGEIFALLGPNGAGKTTTIRMLMGILQPTEGRAEMNGLDCFRERADVMRQVGYMPDEPIFYDYLRGREIIDFCGQMRGLSAGDMERCSSQLVNCLGLQEDLEEYAANYSKGMKKKLAAVLAFLHDPRLLILDEPTNGLDPYATRTVHELVRARAEQGTSVFFSTHLLDQAEKLCTRVGILCRGRLAAVGSLEELRARSAADGSLEEIFFSVTSDAGPVASGGATDDT